MQRSSESIGALAGALAKAQAELTNPTKSLTATIPGPVSAGGGQNVPLCPAIGGSGDRPEVSRPT